MSGTALNCL